MKICVHPIDRFLLYFVGYRLFQQLFFNLILGSYTLTELKYIVHLTTQSEESEID